MNPAGLTQSTEFSLLWLIPFFPLVGAAINGLFGAKLLRKMGPGINHGIAILAPTLSFIVTMLAMSTLLGLGPEERALSVNLFPFIHVGFFDSDMAFWFDPLSATLTCIITFIGTLIHVYSVGYMDGDSYESTPWRFFCYLNLFMAAMLTLVLGDNLLVMFIGWEGVGLCSYLLISFWYKEKANAVAGMKAFVVNRVGDFGFVIASALLFWGTMGSYSAGAEAGYKQGDFMGHEVAQVERLKLDEQSRVGIRHRNEIMPASLRFDAIRARVQSDKASWEENSPSAKTFWGVPLVLIICIFFFVGAAGKSAQIPLYVWLPDAMAGPTPVSALIHAATMVTAGVYMVARMNFLFSLSPTAMTIVTVVGALTAFFAATIGLFQYDIKKVLAYSTVSQLGYMFIGVGTGAYWAGVYHLLTHAVFKACLFLGSGSVILGCHHEQDMRKMGGLKKYMPITHWTYFFSCIAITTAPFFFLSNGFFSKDEILWKAFDAQFLLVPGSLIWFIGWLGAGMTSFYMWRSYYMTFTGEYRGGESDHGHQDDHGADDHHGHHGGEPHESPRTMTWVLVILAAAIIPTSILGLWPLLGDMIPAFKEPIFEHWLHPVVGHATESLDWWSKTADKHDLHFWEFTLAGASVAWTLLTWFVARLMYKDAKSTLPERLLHHPSPLLRKPYELIYNKYRIDEFYDVMIVQRTRQWGRVLYSFDQKIIDGVVNFFGLFGRAIGNIEGMIDTFIVDGMVNGVANGIGALGKILRRTQTGRLQTYLAGSIVGVITLVFLNYVLF